MELTFHSQDEFEQFARVYMRGLSRYEGPLVSGSTEALLEAQAELERFNTTTDREVLQCAMADTGLTEEQLTGSQTTEAPKRKRRTKAEMEAARAAEQSGEPLVTDEERAARTEPDAEPENQQNSEPVTTETHPLPTTEQPAKTEAEHVANIVELAGYTDQVREDIRGNAAMFEPDRMAQMNEGREAIKAKGIAAYNAIAKALDLSVNIALHNDDQVRLHRAGIAHLMASK